MYDATRTQLVQSIEWLCLLWSHVIVSAILSSATTIDSYLEMNRISNQRETVRKALSTLAAQGLPPVRDEEIEGGREARTETARVSIPVLDRNCYRKISTGRLGACPVSIGPPHAVSLQRLHDRARGGIQQCGRQFECV